MQPGLAKSWDISKDGKTYTFHLNHNMTFSNGDKLDADDVAWSINQLKEKQYYNANQVESLEQGRSASTPNTVQAHPRCPGFQPAVVPDRTPGTGVRQGRHI